MGSHSKAGGLPDLTDEKIWVGNPSNRPVEEDKPEGDLGLSYKGTVTTYTDTTHFKASGLAGYGDTFFKGYFVYVVRDAGGAGAAPQHEQVEITDYVSSDGTFTHDVFTTPLAEDDEILILLLPAAMWSNMQASDKTIASSPVVASTASDTYVKLKEFRVPRAGTYRVKWACATSEAGRGSWTRVYKNGAAVGVEKETIGDLDYHDLEDDVGGFAHGDLLQLYGHNEFTRICYVKNFFICAEATPYIGKITLD